jgi:ubiquinone/menaquinone biosynthesis C-methylase UbiE
MNLQETYDAIAETWHEEEAKGSAKHRPGLGPLLQRLPPGSRVLDVGCGTGIIAQHLLAAGMSVVGIDVSEGMLSIARRECPQGVFVQMDLQELATLDQSFEAVCAVAVLLHRPRAELVVSLRAFHAKLHPGGMLYVVVKEKRDDRPEEGVVTDDRLGFTIERFFSFYTQEEVEEAFQQAGFEVVFSEVVSSGRARWIEVVGQRSEA